MALVYLSIDERSVPDIREFPVSRTTPEG